MGLSAGKTDNVLACLDTGQSSFCAASATLVGHDLAIFCVGLRWSSQRSPRRVRQDVRSGSMSPDTGSASGVPFRWRGGERCPVDRRQCAGGHLRQHAPAVDNVPSRQPVMHQHAAIIWRRRVGDAMRRRGPSPGVGNSVCADKPAVARAHCVVDRLPRRHGRVTHWRPHR